MNHIRTSDTLFDVTRLYKELEYPVRLLQWDLKGRFFQRTLVWYFKRRYTAAVRNLLPERRALTLLNGAMLHLLRDIPIKSNDDPTALIRSVLSKLFVTVELFIENPVNGFPNPNPHCDLDAIDLPSDHEYQFVLLQPREKNRVKNDKYAFYVMGEYHYYLAMRLGD